MAVQRITHKKIVKYDTKNPNFNPDFEIEIEESNWKRCSKSKVKR